jgi:K+-sensing histidine kinase KdpD
LLPPFLTFVAAIMLTALYGGFPAALFAIVLSAVTINSYFIRPIGDLGLKPGDAGTIGFFTVEAFIMAYCIDYLRKNENRLRGTNLALEQQVVGKRQELTEQEEKVRSLMYQLARTESGNVASWLRNCMTTWRNYSRWPG